MQRQGSIAISKKKWTDYKTKDYDSMRDIMKKVNIHLTD